MTVSPGADHVRRIAVATFEQFGAAEATELLDETILIDGGRYVGRSYRAGSLFAMWMVEIGLLQFYDADGNMLRTVNLLEELEPQRVAA